MQHDDTLLDPLLQPSDPLRPHPTLVVQSIRPTPQSSLDLLRAELGLSSPCSRQQIRSRIEFRRSSRSRGGCIVQRESLDSQQTVIDEPLGEESLLGRDEGAEGEVVL